MIIHTHTATLQGLRSTPIDVEAGSCRGKPEMTLIGLPAKAVEEAKERIVNALSSCGVRLKCKKTLVNLAPADLRKDGSHLELAIALALWQLTTDNPCIPADDIFFGELSLDGSLRTIRGGLPLVHFARERGFRRVFIPAGNAPEVQIIAGITIYPVKHLHEILDFYAKQTKLTPLVPQKYLPGRYTAKTDFAHIIGQNVAKRCLEIAAAGGHNLLLCGVPGAGKSLLASALPSILPPLTRDEALEITTIYSVCGLLDHSGLISVRPCRAPHHTISSAGLAGGGVNLLPGEISLAHHGILFLDELGEFRRDALEILRQPLETGTITLSRASGHVVYPADVTLIAATNPCPCGYLGSKKRPCVCSAREIARYRHKLSGPILDRLDMQIFVPEVDLEALTGQTPPSENSALVRARVIRARKRQACRLAPLQLTTNSELASSQVRTLLALEPPARQLLERATATWQLSARSYFKLIKVARTIADLSPDDHPAITAEHIAEALQYRHQWQTEPE